MKKLYITIATLSIFLMMLTPIVFAQDTLTYTDETGDVLDASTGDTVSRPNIDINIISASKEGKVVEVKLQLATGGTIQNKVSTYYELDLTTDLNSYMAFYGGGEIGVTDQDDNEVDLISSSGVGTNILSFSFNLSSADEVMENLTAASFEISVDSQEGYYDEYPNQMEVIDVEIDSPSSGTVGKSIKFRGSTNYTGADVEWSWDFGDNDTSDLKEPTHSFSKAGTYEVSLEVFDATGLVYGFASTSITISPSSSDGNNGGNQQSSSGLIVFIVIIIIVIAIVVAAVFFIRRR